MWWYLPLTIKYSILEAESQPRGKRNETLDYSTTCASLFDGATALDNLHGKPCFYCPKREERRFYALAFQRVVISFDESVRRISFVGLGLSICTSLVGLFFDTFCNELLLFLLRLANVRAINQRGSEK